MQTDPRIVFERLFGDGGTPEQRAAQARMDRSILDSVTEAAARFQRRLGPDDRTRVGEYLDAIRDLERRIQRIATDAVAEVEVPDAPVGVPDDVDAHIRLMLDLQVLAYQADVTRVVTFQLGREVSQRTFPEIGVPDPHHSNSHHLNDPARLEKIARIDTFLVQLFAYYLEKLRATPDGDGSLLDNVMVLYGGGISDGNLHIHTSLPLVVAGHGGGRLAGGRNLEYPAGTPHANLLVSLLHKAGVPVEKIGDSTGRLDGLSDV
jgi:hypothetical protein